MQNVSSGKYSKAELHLHMDGALTYSVIPKLAEMTNMELDEKDIPKLVTVPDGCRNLVEYLKCFDLPIRLLQTRDALMEAVKDLVLQLYREETYLAELRFAPMQHLQLGLTGEQVVEAAIAGLNAALALCNDGNDSGKPKMHAGLILCMMIGASDEANSKVVELTSKYLGKGVIALDLAGAEGMVPMDHYAPFFARASKLDIPYTIHAGECFDENNIMKALDLGARRIGHGVACIKDRKVIDRLLREEIPLEVCLISNLQTIAMKDGRRHPVKELMDLGVKVTLNTDNRTVSGTTLDREYELMKREYGVTEADIRRAQEISWKSSFLF